MSDPKDMLVCADMAALVSALGATRKVLERGVTALERIAGALEMEREWVEHARVDDAVDALILAELEATPQSVEHVSERLRAAFSLDNTRVFDGNIPRLQERLVLLAMMGKAFESFGHMWSLVEPAR